MKWTIKWASRADSNDADYIYTHGTFGIVDDQDKDDMQRLLFEMQLASYAEDHFDNGWFRDVDTREDLIALLTSSKLPEDVVTKFVDKYIGDENDSCFVDHLRDELDDYVPNDPEDDSHAHDLHIKWIRIPGDVTETDFDMNWVEQQID